MDTEVRDAWERFRKLRFPKLGKRSHFVMYDSTLAGVASTYLRRGTIKDRHVPAPSEETLAYIGGIRGKGHHSDEERLLLQYFDALEEVRIALERAAQSAP